MNFYLRVSCVLLAASVFAQAPYKDPKLPFEKRVDDLVSRMTAEEKISQLMNDSVAIPRLDVPAYNWWNECLHGVARAGRATVFPETIGLAATWDTELLHRVSSAISDEGRAKFNDFTLRGKRNIYEGLTFWTPNINLFRDPRWGRGMETYGEDPFLTGKMAVAFIKGLQGDDPKYLKTVATAKHFAVHSGPEPSRHTFDAVISEEDLQESYLPHFEMAIKEGGAYSVMCAYNRVDGKAACASPKLLQETLRRDWGFSGYVVSDCGAVGDVYKNHKVEPDAEHGVAATLKTGTDLNCGTEYTNLQAAYKAGLVTDKDLDTAVHRLFMARFKLGLFDPPAMVKYASIPLSENDSPAHRQLALETARKAIVLLKNENHTLPLKKTLKTIAVIGPNADDFDSLVGNYNGEPSHPITPLAGIKAKLGANTKVIYARGSDFAEGTPNFETIPSSALFTSNGADRKNGLNGAYYNVSNFDGMLHQPAELTYPGSGKMTGTIPENPQPLFTRIDPQIKFQWWDGAPRAGMKDDDFGVRWTGFLIAPVSGKYQIGATGMNAFEIYLDGKKIVDFNNIHERAFRYEAVDLEAGNLYPIRVDYHEYVGDADIQLVWSKPGENPAPAALQAAQQADAVIMVLGLSPRLEGEEMKVPVAGFAGGDRVSLNLPKVQEDLLSQVVALGKPTVLVLMNGSGLAVNWARDYVPAIVEAWYPGQAGGTAIADVLFGDYNPGGRLPVTFYRSANDLPPFTDYSMKGKTYRFFTGEPLFPFGYGLSYTKFAYSKLMVPEKSVAGEDVKISVDVSNVGDRAGDEVVELYVKVPPARFTRAGEYGTPPIRSLAGFRRVTLAPKEHKTVEFTLTARQLALVNALGESVVWPGTIEISVGGVQPGFSGSLGAESTGVAHANLQVTGTAKRVH